MSKVDLAAGVAAARSSIQGQRQVARVTVHRRGTVDVQVDRARVLVVAVFRVDSRVHEDDNVVPLETEAAIAAVGIETDVAVQSQVALLSRVFSVDGDRCYEVVAARVIVQPQNRIAGRVDSGIIISRVDGQGMRTARNSLADGCRRRGIKIAAVRVLNRCVGQQHGRAIRDTARVVSHRARAAVVGSKRDRARIGSHRQSTDLFVRTAVSRTDRRRQDNVPVNGRRSINHRAAKDGDRQIASHRIGCVVGQRAACVKHDVAIIVRVDVVTIRIRIDRHIIGDDDIGYVGEVHIVLNLNRCDGRRAVVVVDDQCAG